MKSSVLGIMFVLLMIMGFMMYGSWIVWQAWNTPGKFPIATTVTLVTK